MQKMVSPGWAVCWPMMGTGGSGVNGMGVTVDKKASTVGEAGGRGCVALAAAGSWKAASVVGRSAGMVARAGAEVGALGVDGGEHAASSTARAISRNACFIRPLPRPIQASHTSKARRRQAPKPAQAWLAQSRLVAGLSPSPSPERAVGAGFAPRLGEGEGRGEG